MTLPFIKQLYQHRVARNAGALGLVQVVNYVASFLVLIQLTRVLGVNTYGVVAFSVGITQVLSILMDLGFTLSATQRISVHRDDRDFVSRLTGAVLCVKLAAYFVGACMVAVYAASTVKYADYSWLFVLSLLPLLGHALQPVWFFSGIERMRYVTLFFVIAKLSFVALVRLLVSKEGDYLWVPVSDGIAQLSAAATGLYLLYRVGYRIALPRLREIKYAIRMTSGFFLSRVSATAYSYSGVLILGMLSAPSTVAIYSLAEQLYRAMHALFSPVVQALYPYMAKERDFGLLGRVAVGCVGVAVTGGVIGHFAGPYLIPLVLGAEWRAALPVLDVFLFAITLHVMAMMSGYPLAAALDRLDVANASVVYSSILYVVLATVLAVAKAASPTALAWLLVISETYVLIHCGVVLWPAARRRHLQRLAERSA